MGWFRPRRRVRDPAGQEWELYVSRVASPGWKEGGGVGGFGGAPATPLGAEMMVASFPLAVASFIWSDLVMPIVRFVVLLPIAIVRGRRSGAVRIEAICFYPDRETRLWTTTPTLVASVLDEIAEGLAAGKVVQPVGAVYSGSHSG